MSRRLWWVTRPSRDLRDIEDSLKCFAKIAEGQRWSANRDLHKRFEAENPVKTPNVGSYGSEGGGGRTWAAWLRSWGNVVRDGPSDSDGRRQADCRI